jgi:hypothetical protein
MVSIFSFLLFSIRGKWELRILNVDLPLNEFFIGEIMAVYSDERYLTNGIPDIKKINPLILSMPENSYFTTGDHIAQAWGAGKKLIKK